MCQLLGMNCAAPTDFTFSLKGFCSRGGQTDKHAHGFGAAIHEGRGLRCFHDTMPACESPIALLMQNYPIRTYNMMAHIRYATQGAVSLENVHPFSRELWGIQWSFAHNGDAPLFNGASSSSSSSSMIYLGRSTEKCACFTPVGDTDSEAAFCAIMNALKAEFPAGLPTLPVLHEFLQGICDEIVRDRAQETIFNFLLGCGQYTMFAYSWPGARPGSSVWNGLHYIVREPPFATAQLLDMDYSIDFSTVTDGNDRVAVVTTKPLTAEAGWCEMKKGELIMFDKGLPYYTAESCARVELEGRGLMSRRFKEKCTRSPGSLSKSPPSQQHLQPPPLVLEATTKFCRDPIPL